MTRKLCRRGWLRLPASLMLPLSLLLRLPLMLPLVLSLSLLLSACSHHVSGISGKDDRRPQAWLAPGVRVTLPAPGISPPVSQQQLLTGTVNGKQQSLLVLLNADQHKIALAGLSSLGIRLFLLTYDESGIHTERTITLPALPPASQVLADVMLSHWPLSAWQGQLPPGWTLRDIGDRRELRNPQGKLITAISYLQRDGHREPIALTQYAFHYHIAIQYLGH